MGILLLRKCMIINTLFLCVIGQIYSQVGCTDLLANNYDSDATQNDASCTYDSVSVSVSKTYPLDAVLSGTSGMIYWKDMLWTHNDHRDTNLYEVNPSDGSIINQISLAPQVNVDWEEISQDEDYVYVGDFGNNVNGNRKDLKIIRISKASILAGTPDMDTIYFSYEDQENFTSKKSNNTDYDCEAFIITETSIYLFTKEWLSNETRVYQLPKTPGTYQARFKDKYNINGLVTGAVYNKQNGIIALSGYSNFLQPFIFLLYDFPEDNFFGGNKRKLNINLAFNQVEGITTKDGFNYFIANEKFDIMGTKQQLHTLDLNPYLVDFLKILPFKN